MRSDKGNKIRSKGGGAAAELFGIIVARGRKEKQFRRVRRVGLLVVLGEEPFHAAGDGRCGVDQPHGGVGDHLLDDVGQKGVVGAAEYDAVGTGDDQRGDGLFDKAARGGGVFLVQSLPSEARVASTPIVPVWVVAAAGFTAGSMPTKGSG